MPKVKVNRPRGRPAKGHEVVRTGGKQLAEIDVKLLTTLAKLPITQTMVAQALGVAPRTLRRFLEQHPEYRTKLKSGRTLWHTDILALQMRAARRLNPAVLIHLGKNYCGQADRQQVETVTARVTEVRLPISVNILEGVRPGQIVEIGSIKPPGEIEIDAGKNSEIPKKPDLDPAN